MAGIDTTLIDRYLAAAWEVGATDLHLTAASAPLVRVDGKLQRLAGTSELDADAVEHLVRAMIGRERFEVFERQRELDFSFEWQARTRIRGNAFWQRGAATLALRIIPFRIPTFDELRIPPAVQQFVTLPQGLVIVTGPTGCGKSTTLASLLSVIAETRADHIITIEDPIEYVFEHRRGAVNQREVGQDTHSFQAALRSALREDPDVLVVGEMRDLDTIHTTLTLAETGHLVFATLHTNDAAQALDRIVDVFPAEEQAQIRVQLAGSLAGVVSQRLIPMTMGGLVAAFEVLIATYAVRNLVRDGRTAQIRNQIATGTEHGMQTLEASLSGLVAEGLITYDEAVALSLYPKEIRRAVAAPVAGA